MILLAAAMTVTVLPRFGTVAHAAELPEASQFATKEQLLTFNTDDTDGKVESAKVNFGKNQQQWWIAGSQNADSLVLFAVEPLEKTQSFENDWNSKKQYSADWECTYPAGTVITEVYQNHYGASEIREALGASKKSSYFTDAQWALMNDTTIYTDDIENSSIYSTEDKLYLAYGEENTEYITVGANSADNLNDGLRVDRQYWGNDVSTTGIWLRAPFSVRYRAQVVLLDNSPVTNRLIHFKFHMKPAFELNLSSVLFASAAPAALSDGELGMTDNVFTLRHTGSVGNVEIIQSMQSVKVTGIANDNTFLVVQNKEGAWAKKVANDDVISASEMSDTLSGFENCKVWLETTTDGVTYAALPAEIQGYSVNVTGNDGLTITSGNENQAVVPGKPITEILVSANDGYYFPEDYSIPAINGISVTRVSYTQLTVSGTPTSDVNLTLAPATEKADRNPPNVTGGIGTTINGTDTTMEYAPSKDADVWLPCIDGSTESGTGTWYVRYKETDTEKASPATEAIVIAPTYTIVANPASLIFDAQSEGYGSIPSQSVTITNTGNSKAALKIPTSSSYEVSLSTDEIDPNGTATLTVVPKKGLTAGEYNETIEIETVQGTSVSVDVSFKVEGAIEVSLSANSESIVPGQSVILTAAVTGGSGTYTYTWYANDTEEPTLQGEAVTVSPSATTTYKVVVTDTVENKTAAATVTVILKNYELEVENDITFGHEHIGYKDVAAKSLKIKNTGSAEVANINVVLTGTNADSFTLDTTGMQTALSPNGETACALKPNTDLAAGTYTAELQVTAENGITKTVAVSFEVEEHDYEVVVTPPTCTSKGYTTHTCKVCLYSYTDNETDMTAHEFGEWKVTKEPTTTTTGEKVRKCVRCSAEEKEVLPMLEKVPDSNEDKPNNENNENNINNTSSISGTKNDNKSPETGDRTNRPLWEILFVGSGLVLLYSLYRGKQR